MSEDDLHARLRALEERVARLDDLEAIRRLKCEHALASDDPANLPQRFADIVTDDFVADYGEGFGVIHGKEELRAFLTNVPFTWTMHFMIPKRIDVAPDGRTATGIWYLWEPALAQDPSRTKSRALWLGAVYDESYRKESDGSWKISALKFDAKLLVPYSEGWEKRRVAEINFDD